MSVGLRGASDAEGSSMSYQAPRPVTIRGTLPPVTIDELVSDPSRAKGLVLESVPELLTQLASRVVARRRAQDARRRAALPDAEPAHRGSELGQREWPVGRADTRQAFRRSGIVGQRTGSPRQSAIDQTRPLRSLQARRSRTLSRGTRQPSRLTSLQSCYTLRIV